MRSGANAGAPAAEAAALSLLVPSAFVNQFPNGHLAAQRWSLAVPARQHFPNDLLRVPPVSLGGAAQSGPQVCRRGLRIYPAPAGLYLMTTARPYVAANSGEFGESNPTT